MKQITLNALVRRARRRARRKGLTLHIHRAGEADYLMGGNLFAYWTDKMGAIVAYTDLSGFIKICTDEGTLRNDEEVVL